MRWVTYSPGPGQAARVGVVHDGHVHGLPGDRRLLDLLALGPEEFAATGTAVLADPTEVVPQDAVTLSAPIPVPPSIRDFMAFENHAATSVEAIGQKLDPVWYEVPVFYFTNPAAVIAPSDPVAISPGSTAFDYEVEVAAVIGRPGSDISVAAAGDHIAGFLILCDWSARDIQAHEMSVGLGPAKGKDSATTLGPWLVTADELAPDRRGNGYDRGMTATVNGTLYSSGNLADLYWSFEEMIAYASRGTRLVPGDVIGSGTVGTGCILELSRVHGADRYPYLTAGDRVRIAVDGLGEIDTSIRPSAPVHPLR
ncbi:fumarylacetoacetate hydrolase family protein [Pseudonocardia alaniniphila]|uniref:Fumarylacetoacetate hydrolase family protein n=1 Tax=Pseudonocardia alaniniphila TaxID=75291 RepID=A0ABS9TUX7_9PSEU|nr:fumarylacetoacetate hydrolase family protein [Pseudonocardia alaniniphila]MCH6172306.1 fumarylacetoacetate hydrolase family protein [Pseudonocardia alaniniphila]